MEKIKNNWKIIVYVILMCVLTGIMFFNINKKEGFHEDEIFSYGASNSKYSSTFLNYRQRDNLDTIMKTANPFETIKRFIYYKLNPDKYSEEETKIITDESIWRTREDAEEYMKIDTVSEAFDFFTVFWNTGRDVHPPLFYFAVHMVSILFFNTFSKYIIFCVNLLFFLATCVILRKIFVIIKKEELSIPNLILYGASIGAISTVMFQRMYMMLTFFTIYFLYTNLKIYYNDFNLTKRLKIELCLVTILGFLTQYYFCFYAACLALVMMIIMIKKKEKKKVRTYILQFVISAIIGVLIFLPSIYHIFFSYRGAGSKGNDYSYFENFVEFVKNIFVAFSLTEVAGIILFIILAIIIVVKFKKLENKELLVILIVPIILNFICIVKLSPYRSLRYVMNILPIVSMIIIIIFNSLFKNIRVSMGVLSIMAILLSTYGLFTNPVKYLYIGYNKYLDIANEYSEDRYVLICQTVFNHIQDAEEMAIYKETLILPPDKLERLKDDENLKEDNEFILSIKNWLGDTDKILNEVLENTGYTSYELLYTSNKSACCSTYKISK